MRISDVEMTKIVGGEGGITQTFLTHLGNFLKTVYNIGQGFGGALRRISEGKVCKL